MPISVSMVATISDRFCQLINKNEYEPLLCRLMNLSKKIFPSHYSWNSSQSLGECDFVDDISKIKFDAKLPFERRHGALIGSRKRDFSKWIELMLQEEAEFGEDISTTRGKNITSLELYKIIEHRLDSVASDENAIFFFPYPLVMDSKNIPILQLVTDYLGAIFDNLLINNKVSGRNIYAIYPSIDGDIVLRCLNTNDREYIKFPELDSYITYSHILNPNNQ